MDSGVLGMGIIFELRDNFSQQSGQINQSLSRLQSNSQAMAEAMQSSINKVQTAFGGLLAGAALMSPFALAVNKAREFEGQLSNIKSLGVLQKDMAEVEKLAMKMGAATKFSAFESAQGIEELLKAGVSLKAIMDKDGLSGALDLAVAGNLKLADAAEISSTALNAFKADNMTIRDAGDILAGAANASATDVMTLKFSLSAVSAVASGVGHSFADTSKALAVFANNGLKGSDAGTSLKTMLMNLQPRSKEQIATFQQLGLITASGANAFFDATGNIKSMADIAGVLNKSLSHLNPQQRAFALETMFGSDAVRAGNILYKEGSKGIMDMAKEMTKFTAASVAKERLNNFNGALEMLMGSIDTMLIKIGQMFLPTLTRLVQYVNVVIDAFQSLISTDIGRYLVIATAAATSFVVVFGAVIPFIQTTIGVMRVLGMVALSTASAFAPYLAVAGIAIVAFKAFSSFKDVLEGTAKPAQGLLGVMQRFGAMMWTVGQVISTWDGKTFNLGGFEKELQSLGILETVKAFSTYIVRFIELVKGVGSGVYSVFATVGSVVGKVLSYIMSGVQSFLRLFGMQNAMMKYSSSSIETWAAVGKVLGYVIGTLLVGATVALTVSLGSMAVAVIAATWPILAVIGAVASVIAVFYYWNDIVAWFTTGWGGAMQAIGVAINKLVAYIQNDMTRDISKALIWVAHYIPIWLGQAFRGALSLITVVVTQFIPWLISQWFNFTTWIISNLPPLLIQAFNLALTGAYLYVTQFIPTVVSLFGQLLWWIVQNVPYLILSAFASAFIFVLNLGKEFLVSIGQTFYDIGKGIMTSLWDGLKAIWNQVVEWWNSAMSYIGLDSVLGAQMETADVLQAQSNFSMANPQKSSNNMVEKVGNTIAENEALKQRQVVNNINNVQGTEAGSFFFTFDLGEGETITKVVEKQQATKEARR